MTKPVVEILLSTFNAGEYLAPLLQSVWSRRTLTFGCMYAMTVRRTARERRSLTWGGRDDVAVDLGGHVGPWKSYFGLLAEARLDGAYVAFCDQDDLWLPGKLSRAVSFLEGSAKSPSLYCGRLTFTDANLNPVGLSPFPRRPLSLSNALVENVALAHHSHEREGSGSYYKKLPAYAIMHDAWSYLVFSALGNIVYDIEPHLLYRIHDRNHMGIQRNHFSVCTPQGVTGWRFTRIHYTGPRVCATVRA